MSANRNNLSYTHHRRPGFALPWLLGAVIGCLGLLSSPSRADEITFFHNDVLGTPLVATNASGTVVWKESYRPYGERLANPPASTGNRLWFTGKPYDPQTGLTYMGARYYDPVLGRFMGMDAAGFNERNLHSVNRYAYANNNPYRYIDPDGNVPVETIWDAANVVYDIGKISVGWLTGNEPLVISGGKDLLVDAISLAIPYVPAGSTKVLAVGADVATGAARGSDAAKGAAAAIDANKLAHIFGNARHNLEPLVQKLGSQEATFSAVQNAAQAAVRNQNLSGVFQTTVNVAGQNVVVRGNVIDGVARIGTFFVP